ncbi:MAG: glycoside hydrolase family 9 protein, partial [Oscillospiraceae bacterium]
WDDVSIGAALMLAKLTGKQTYKDIVEKNLDWWTTGTGGERIAYTPKGLAWLDGWGSLRYATTSAFIAAVYSDWNGCPSAKKKTYTDFYESQIDYALGSSGRSYVVGFGNNPPEHPHHRTAQGSWADNMSEPGYHRHTLYGALVGGPNGSDGYTDTVSDYNCNEVACDYNAGFVGVLAKMYGKYGGKTIKNFGAIEPVGEELYVEYRTNAQGNGFTEIKAVVYNKTSWPARVTDNLELRYYMDLSEIYNAGGTAADLTVTTNYSEGAKSGGIFCHNEAKHIYYVSIDFSGTKIYPGGQSAYKKEVQFRITSNSGVWDPSNDPSYQLLIGTNGSTEIRAECMALYERGKLVFGAEPDGKSISNPKPVTTATGGTTSASQQTTSKPTKPNAEDNGITVSLEQSAVSGMGNTIQFTLNITNNTGAAIDLSKLEIDYFFTADGSNDLCFWCDHAALNGAGGYSALTSSVNAAFSSMKGKDCDTKCAIKFSGGSFAAGDSMTIQVRITRADWTDFNLGNDYSAGNAQHILILKGGSPLFGQKP